MRRGGYRSEVIALSVPPPSPPRAASMVAGGKPSPYICWGAARRTERLQRQRPQPAALRDIAGEPCAERTATNGDITRKWSASVEHVAQR